MVSFSTWIFEQFPRYFKEFDTYKDNNNQGLFERFLGAIGDEMDANLVPKITNFTDLFDVLTTPDKYLILLTKTLGSPPDLFYNDARYRRFLRYLVDIVKCKGTVESYNMLFRLLDCTVTIEEIPLVDMRYDTTNHYDTGLKYDEECPSCSFYNLHITDPNGTLPSFDGGPTDREFLLLRKIIEFVEPINAKLLNITIDGDPIASDQWVLTTGIWDNGLYWNDYKFYRDTP